MFIGQILLNSLVIGTQVTLLVVPLYLLYSVSKIYHFALGAIAAAVAYGLFFGLSNGYSWGISIFFAVITAIILGVVSYLLLESFTLRQEDTFGLLASFAFGVVIESAIAIIFGTDGKFLSSDILSTISFGSLYVTLPGIITLVAGFFLAIIFILILSKTPWGRELRSVAENNIFASSLSINASKARLTTYIVASLLAGFIGIMISANTVITPQMGFHVIIMAFIALLVGGVYSLKGVIVASYLLTLVSELLIGLSSGDWSLSASWKMFIVFIIAMVLLLWRPNGLLSTDKREN